jgi:hypothetical protein
MHYGMVKPLAHLKFFGEAPVEPVSVSLPKIMDKGEAIPWQH